ncbi:LSM domain, eukaryotic/archaea-type, partial [Dillenia turbinata]
LTMGFCFWVSLQVAVCRFKHASLVFIEDCLRLVELKNGETYNVHLVNCDTRMNIHLREVIYVSNDGDRFWRMPECYICGNTIKYL